MSAIMRAMRTLPLFQIQTDQDQVPPDKDKGLSQLLALAKEED